MNIGVDFGTTYSTFASYDRITNTVNEIDFGEVEKVCVPSIVCYDTKTKKFRFGSDAQKQIWIGKGDRNRFYQAFKMLLPERDKALLKSRGYLEQTPQEIAGKFLGNFLNMAKAENEKYKKMVVCVPEIWNGSSNTLDGRNNLRQLCKDLNVAETLQIVTEPEAASAYFIHNYEKQNNTPYTGYVLTVDYGGGTLDITLTKTQSIEHEGRRITQLRSLARSGRGENHDKEVGAAGMAYMEGVVTEALREAGILGADQEPERGTDFLQAVHACESALMSRENQKDLRQTFGSLKFDYEEIKQQAGDVILDVITYDGEDVNINYGHLIKAYERIIYPVLDSGLEHIIQLANSLGADAVDLLDPKEQVLYASVGGFGKFLLVENQVYAKLGYSAAQQLKNNNLLNKRESAVALGAALIADDVLTIQPIAAHSLGIYAKRSSQGPNGRIWTSVVNYAIRFGQPVEPNKKYYVRSQSDPTRLMGYAIGTNGLGNFLIGYNTNYATGCLMPVRDAFLKKLKGLPGGRVAVGFSQDEDGVIFIHVHPVDDFNELAGKHSLDIRLSTFDELFETVETQVIQDGEEVRS